MLINMFIYRVCSKCNPCLHDERNACLTIDNNIFSTKAKQRKKAKIKQAKSYSWPSYTSKHIKRFDSLKHNIYTFSAKGYVWGTQA